ncbi:hypothetical protein Fcan01_23736 [Folsomia candida]|uniref:Uncharacterized protein n=1 Tax=Folsomia candida TaxID=158441 RepID=A0A226D8U4_FOLCA|nr:hypothetical protein Fcan01_23736 [Folsomia candida]
MICRMACIRKVLAEAPITTPPVAMGSTTMESRSHRGPWGCGLLVAEYDDLTIFAKNLSPEATGLTQYAEKFKENDVDDTVFLKFLNGAAGSVEERLFAEIVPSVGHRFKLITAAREVEGTSKILDSDNQTQPPSEDRVDVEISFVDFTPLFDVKQVILTSDQQKGTIKGRQILEDCLESNVVTFEAKSLIKRRIVNYLIQQYTYLYLYSIILRGLKYQKTVKRWLFFNLVYVIVETLLVASRQDFRMLMFLAGYWICMVLRLEKNVDTLPMALHNWWISKKFQD